MKKMIAFVNANPKKSAVVALCVIAYALLRLV